MNERSGDRRLHTFIWTIYSIQVSGSNVPKLSN